MGGKPHREIFRETMKALEDIIDLERLPLFLSKVDYRGDNGCWNWTAGLKGGGLSEGGGYGEFIPFLGGNNRSTHALFYEIRYGVVPKGLEIDHTCRNRRCCNPKHLEAVTRAENNRRGESITAKNARKTHCGNCGGEFDYFFIQNGYPHRACKACGKRRQQLAREAKKKGQL